jgi:hypothetical protein
MAEHSGAKALADFAALTARLKSCPFKTQNLPTNEEILNSVWEKLIQVMVFAE